MKLNAFLLGAIFHLFAISANIEQCGRLDNITSFFNGLTYNSNFDLNTSIYLSLLLRIAFTYGILYAIRKKITGFFIKDAFILTRIGFFIIGFISCQILCSMCFNKEILYEKAIDLYTLGIVILALLLAYFPFNTLNLNTLVNAPKPAWCLVLALISILIGILPFDYQYCTPSIIHFFNHDLYFSLPTYEITALLVLPVFLFYIGGWLQEKNTKLGLLSKLLYLIFSGLI